MRGVLVFILLAAPALAQEPLALGELYRDAISADPRTRQLELEAEQTALRLRNLESERLPVITLQGEAKYQSDVPEIPFTSPGESASSGPPREAMDLHVDAQQPILDPTRDAREAVERARLAEAEARVHAAVAALRREVDEAFFTALSLQQREAEVGSVIRDLEARLEEARLRVEAGMALPSEAMILEATLLRREQDVSELRAHRRAALERLAALTGRPFVIETRLAPPRLDAVFEKARASLDFSGRPELAQMERSRERLESQKVLAGAQQKVRIFGYARAGYGRPGLNFLSDELDAYWLAGIRLQWRPWDWDVTERERRILELQQDALDTEREALERSILRATANDLALAEHLAASIETDARIVELREAIEREARARFEERVITAAEYVDRQTDVLDARLLMAAHRVELAQAQARVLTLLGWEVR